MDTYTSPLTGVRYQIQFVQTRWPRYEILLDGHCVQFALTKDAIADSVAHFENPGADGIWSSARD